MKTDLQSVRRHLPGGAQLPRAFEAWARACARVPDTAAELRWCDPDSGGWRLGPEVVPFLQLPFGGYVAFWFPDPREKSLAPIIWISSEGEARLVGTELGSFLTRSSRRQTGAWELDDRKPVQVTLPTGPAATAMRAIPSALRRQFEVFVSLRSDEGLSIDRAKGELLRRDWAAAAQAHPRRAQAALELTVLFGKKDTVALAKSASGARLAADVFQRPIQRLRRILKYPPARVSVRIESDGTVVLEGRSKLRPPSYVAPPPKIDLTPLLNRWPQCPAEVKALQARICRVCARFSEASRITFRVTYTKDTYRIHGFELPPEAEPALKGLMRQLSQVVKQPLEETWIGVQPNIKCVDINYVDLCDPRTRRESSAPA